MAAMDGNPTRKDAWETSRDRRTEESILREKGWPDTEDSDGSGTGNELPANQKIVPGGIPGAASETPRLRFRPNLQVPPLQTTRKIPLGVPSNLPKMTLTILPRRESTH